MKPITNSIRILLCLFLYQQTLVSQHHVTLKGKVYDKVTKEPLAYASVYVPNSGTGVLTNQFGEFPYHIPYELETSLVNISYMGYKTMLLNFSFIKQDSIYYFPMTQEIKSLHEVEITGKKGPSASDVVKIAITRIPKNYPDDKFQLHCYYRDYIHDKNNYKNFLEAAVIIEDRGFDTQDYPRSKIKLEQIRYNPGFNADTLLNSSYDGISKYIPFTTVDKSNELALLRLQDPIRNHKRNVFSYVDIFDFDFIPNHQFHYESIIYSDSVKIFEIAFDTRRERISVSSKREYLVKGKIYINAKDYAILKFNYTVNCKIPAYTGKFFDFSLEYKSFKDKYYLNYMSMCNYFEYRAETISSGNSGLQQYLQYRELFVNKVVPGLLTQSSLKKRSERMPSC